MDTTRILETARKAAEAAAGVHKSYSKSGFTSSAKKQHHDMVTSADIDSERAIVEILRTSFPDHNILAEEGSYPETASPYTWIIDPLDGTNNFFKGFPHYAVSIGVALEGEIIAGIVRNTAGEGVFSAEKGKGAFYDGSPIRVSRQDSLKNAMLFTGFYYDRGDEMRKTLGAIEHFFKKGIIGIRRTGCAALDLCYTAAGWGDGFWEHRLSPWDYAAGKLILSEAGGTLTDFSGSDPALATSSIIAANGRLHSVLRREFAELQR